jgi:hypothetical protein
LKLGVSNRIINCDNDCASSVVCKSTATDMTVQNVKLECKGFSFT